MPQNTLNFQKSMPSGVSQASSPSNELLELSSQQFYNTDSTRTSQNTPSEPPSSSHSKPRSSWVFHHMPDEDIETRYYNKETGQEEWHCRYCTQVYRTSGSTSGPSKHLIDDHKLKKNDSRNAKAKSQQISLNQAFQIAKQNPQKRCRLDDGPGESINPDHLEVLFVKMIAACSLPFRIVECPEFRAFLYYLNVDIDTWLPGSHNTIKRWVIRQYKSQKERIKQHLHSARSKIHISCDIWTSPNSLPILGIVAHYITEDGKLRHSVLALKDIDGEHNGENLADIVVQVIKEWGFASKLGFFVMDNATNNDTMMRSISLKLLRQFDIRYDPKHHRLRCQGHIINLAVKSFLFVTDNENLEEEQNMGILQIGLKEIEEWRQDGPLGKLHDFVIFIQRSVQRLGKFLLLSNNHRLTRDNSTRWNSWYTMLKTALHLQHAIEEYFEKWVDDECINFKISSDEWVTIKTITSFLEKLKMTTKALESSTSTLDNVLPAIDYILTQFEKGKEDNQFDNIMAPMYNSGWAKINKYYCRTDESPAYIAAIILHPSYKWQYVEHHWNSSWIVPAKKMMQDFWNNEYKPIEQSLPPQTQPLSTTNEFLQWIGQAKLLNLTTDEYLQYCQADRVYGFESALTWWLEETQQLSYPNLSKMAIDILSIPAMSAEPERLFSGAKITVTDRRNQLGIEVIQALECLKSWLGINDWEEDHNVDIFE
ncbi:putative AC transposase [Neolecta irregularis DAH-3]|uniref:Putative AC transposase n=1 Tax=Neolecta irregularis (strain DAH-3) TaxID=1198029 RepID=A0A1U7LV61_NEOID|nr:putative AC transposase [Neolecta irregularis DAH-3]|eukprot:OLL26463.1 putative AC transposase [Neolecta irregularis DAH-3]